MDLIAWTLYLLIAGTIIGAAFLHYRYREPKGTARWLLAGVRGLALAAIVLLLFNPRIPSGPRDAPSVVALIDGSASMGMATLEADGPGTPWEAAWAAVDSMAPDRVFLATDDGLEPAVRDAPPTGLGSRLAPALRAALESGADRVVVLTDGAVEDPVDVRRLREAAGVEVRVLGGERAFNAGIAAISAPGRVNAGKEARVAVAVTAVGAGGPDSLRVALRRDGRELARRWVATPPTGREVSIEIPFVARNTAAGAVRLEAVLVDGGSERDDDARYAYVRVGDDPGGVALLSLAPGQEARFLMPVIGRATGLPVNGWAAVAEDRWVRIAAGAEAGRVANPASLEVLQAALRGALREADLVVIVGLGADAPDWVVGAVETSRRVLVFPGEAAPGLPFDPGPAREADWYVAEGVPASPVAPLMAGAVTEGLPPLRALRTPSVDGSWAPMVARAGRRGEPRPVLLAGEVDGRRLAVALGDGYWRWAFAGPEGRAFYARFWSAVGGWLVEETDRPAAGIEPVARAVARGTGPLWRVPDGDSARIRLEPAGARSGEGAGRETGDSAAVRDTASEWTVAVRDGVAGLPPVAPGHYRYTVSSGSGTGSVPAEGEITVSGYTPELTRPVAVASWRSPDGAAGRAGGRTPLRSTPWGYIVVLVLLSVEWALRRRWGLR